MKDRILDYAFYWLFFSLLAILALTFTTNCTTTKVAPTPPAAPVLSLKLAWDTVHPEWTPMLENALKTYGQGLLTGEYPGVCGDKLAYWSNLFVAVAKRESNWKPTDKMQESFKDSKGNPQISAGIFQLSLDDGKNNGSACAQFKVFADVLDPKKNIECAVVIMNRWVTKDKVIALGSETADAKGGARYWSVLREGKTHFKAEILEKAKVACK